MKNLIFILFLLLPTLVLADQYSDLMNSPTFRPYTLDQAITITEGAFMQREDVKLLSNNFEKWGWKCLHSVGITEGIASPVVIFTTTFVQQKISTRGINMHWEPAKNLILRPDVEYNFNGSGYNTTFTAGWKF